MDFSEKQYLFFPFHRRNKKLTRMLISIVSHHLNLLALDIIVSVHRGSPVKHTQYIFEFYWFYFDINSNCVSK